MTNINVQELQDDYKHLFSESLERVFNQPFATQTIVETTYRGHYERCEVKYFGAMCLKNKTEIDKCASSLINNLNRMADYGYFHNALSKIMGVELCDPNTPIPLSPRSPAPPITHYGVVCYLSVYPEFLANVSNHKYAMLEGGGVSPYDPNDVITKQCECGKEKHNFIAHSTWCPKFEGFY